MHAEAVITRTARIWLGADGLIQAVVLPTGQLHRLEDAQENMAVIAGFAVNKKRPVLIDMRAMSGIEREARAYYASGGGRRVATAVALLIGSPVSRVIANFLIRLHPPPIRIQLFTSAEAAAVWLQQFIE
jgi:hypothetical protein